MNLSSTLFRATLVITSLISMACGQGLKTSGSDALSSLCSNCGGGNNGSSIDPRWGQLDLKGAPATGAYEMTMIDFDPPQKTLKIIIPMPGVNIPVEARLPIPELPGAAYVIEAGPDGSLRLIVEIPLTRVMRNIDIIEPQRLPNGDPLPGYPDGEGPRLGVKVAKSKRDIFIFAGKSAAAVFVPLPGVNIPAVLGQTVIPIRSENERRTLGYFSIVPVKGSHSGGVFVSAVLPPDMARLIDDLL